MVCFCLLNLHTVPYMVQIKAEKVQRREMMEFTYSKVTDRPIPQLSDNFDLYKAASLNIILSVGKTSMKFDSDSHASVKELQEIIQRGKIYRNYPLVIHQGSALENAAVYHSGTYCLF